MNVYNQIEHYSNQISYSFPGYIHIRSSYHGIESQNTKELKVSEIFKQGPVVREHFGTQKR